ncbi:MAG: response regulator transcription factor [Chloroflexi bacterium]|nr:response regulator transcription factor [Chloroflexota bacterium]
MSAHILIVDDDDLLRRSLAFSLEQSGFQVTTAVTAEDAFGVASQTHPDLIILDIMLPGMDGLTALRQFRDVLQIPVIFLTARRRELDHILGMELGADDYITKPFNPDVLISHIRAVLRRVSGPRYALHEPSTIVLGDLEIDPNGRTVTIGGKAVSLTPKEFELLYALALEPNRVLSVETLLARGWGAEYIGEPQIVYVHIRWLREKIEQNAQDPKRIVTVRGVGYKLIPQENIP